MRLLRSLLIFVLVTSLVFAGGVWWWLDRPLSLRSEAAEFDIEPGTAPRRVADVVAQAGVQVRPVLFYAWLRLSGASRHIKAGNYSVEGTVTPRQLARRLVEGEETQLTVTIVEGWTFDQMRAALARAEHLRPSTREMPSADIMTQLGRPGQGFEGRFSPDTYHYGKGASDLTVLRRAMHTMDKRLAAAWAARQPGVQLRTPEEALILASIIEKETGKGSDRALISSVFHNRLRIGMLLQTDPTVIYGMGDRFDGNLRRRDLQTDTPWNTYTRGGLPPTPIALPGQAALLAAVQPAATQALYFVARGDGSSQFSATLDEHNRAVNKYQRGGK